MPGVVVKRVLRGTEAQAPAGAGVLHKLLGKCAGEQHGIVEVTGNRGLPEGTVANKNSAVCVRVIVLAGLGARAVVKKIGWKVSL